MYFAIELNYNLTFDLVADIMKATSLNA